MHGLLIVDKPAGPTSHDVVARMRRALREPRIGHTGTLDPMASGVLPLVLGRATRLAQFLSASEKTYEAVVCLGYATDTYDAVGTPSETPFTGEWPTRAAIDEALDRFRGTFDQQPPAFSAKKVAGRRSYDLARSGRSKGPPHTNSPIQPAVERASARSLRPVESGAGLQPCRVTTHAVDIVSVDESHVLLRIVCSAGFYVRSLAHDLGQALGTGAHLSALKRTACCGFGLDHAVALDDAERNPAVAEASVVPMRSLLGEFPLGVLTRGGLEHASHGRELGPADFIDRPSSAGRVRLLDEDGELVGIATPGSAPGLLHPSIILM
jgi:tRNA pseudouridine55 synthase